MKNTHSIKIPTRHSLYMTPHLIHTSLNAHFGYFLSLLFLLKHGFRPKRSFLKSKPWWYIASPQVRNSYCNCVASLGKGVLCFFREDLLDEQSSSSTANTHCILHAMSFAAGDFGGSALAFSHHSIRFIEILLRKVAEQTHRRGRNRDEELTILPNTKRTPDWVILKSESGLTLSFKRFLLNPGEWSWSSVIWAGFKKCGCEPSFYVTPVVMPNNAPFPFEL